MEQKDFRKISEAAKQIYDYGCYFMSLLYARNLRTHLRNIYHSETATVDEVLTCYDTFVSRGWMDLDCYVKDPCSILRYLTGKTYTVKKDIVLDPNANIIIGLWHNPATNLHHFVVMDSNNSVTYDPLGDSTTVANGYIESYRLFYERH